MVKIIFDIIHSDRDVATLDVVKYLNKCCYNVCRNNRHYYRNYWNLIRLGRFDRIKDSIIELFLEKLKLTPYPKDIYRLIENKRFNRINSRESLTWSICFDDIISTYKDDPDPDIIRRWMYDYLYINTDIHGLDEFCMCLNGGPILPKLSILQKIKFIYENLY